MAKKQISVNLHEEFIAHAAGIARAQNRSISSLLGEACYRWFQWDREADGERQDDARGKGEAAR